MKGLFICCVCAIFLGISPKYSYAEKEIMINLWHRTLQLVDDGTVIKTYPVGPGAKDTPTPIGQFTVIEKSKNWGKGFGTRWIEINVPWGTYGIHGTNKPGLVGNYVSHGCIRMKNKHIEELYGLVNVGTKVTIDGPLTGHKDLTYRILVLGSKGSLVQIVQNRLQAAGYYKGICHGKFDRLTEIAVSLYQKDHRLPITGQIFYSDLLHMGIME
ncbi:L,D-transpeptidase family protein [Ammoniphilus resinae]|uniref:L,D-TPase catalytic domain-containing protein n=1 Tax=Ammoniphilus resinae TaxID=861532 RepID=A0ABS4GIN8_9BACL|nr:L,D-transpeptidase family protein [Ammoniphilus resinae]MBP1930123.1 hypothetical protein [Ammoniphilus resinae]